MTTAVKRKPIQAKQHTKPGKSLPRKAAIQSAMNVNEEKDEYILYVTVHGMERKDFSIRITQGQLMISAEKPEALHSYGIGDEPVFTSWTESFTLPEDADTVMTAAVYRNGELEIHIPRGRRSVSEKPVEVYVY